MNIFAFIPARSGSERIKDKNIYNLNGHPLLAYTIFTSAKAKIFKEIICITDSETYSSIAKKYGASVPGLRPKSISTSTSHDYLWVDWALKKLSDKINDNDLIFILRPTSPLRTTNTLKRALNQFLEYKDVDSLRAVEVCKQIY